MNGGEREMMGKERRKMNESMPGHVIKKKNP